MTQFLEFASRPPASRLRTAASSWRIRSLVSPKTAPILFSVCGRRWPEPVANDLRLLWLQGRQDARHSRRQFLRLGFVQRREGLDGGSVRHHVDERSADPYKRTHAVKLEPWTRW